MDGPTTTLKGQNVGFYALELFVRYVEVTGDRSMDEKILGLLGETKLSKANLDVVEKVFPDYSKAMLAARSIKVEFKTNGDEFLLSELADEVQKVNEWVEVTPDATKKILFNRPAPERAAHAPHHQQRNHPRSRLWHVADPAERLCPDRLHRLRILAAMEFPGCRIPRHARARPSPATASSNALSAATCATKTCLAG